MGNIETVNTLLSEVYGHMQFLKLDIHAVKQYMEEEIIPDKGQMIESALSYHTKTMTKKRGDSLNFNDFRRVLGLYAVLGNLYNAIGDQVNCEKMYIQYIKCIEKLYEPHTVEVSNCYFLIGIYYIEQVYIYIYIYVY